MNEERLNKLLEDIDNALYNLKICQCNINVTAKGHKWETYYGLDDDLIKYIRKIESSNKNLQSKIVKVNELIEENKDQVDWLHMPAWELEDILKEDK